jgi:hypothetical protein
MEPMALLFRAIGDSWVALFYPPTQKTTGVCPTFVPQGGASRRQAKRLRARCFDGVLRRRVPFFAGPMNQEGVNLSTPRPEGRGAQGSP